MMDNPHNNFLNKAKQSGQAMMQFLFEPPAIVTKPDERLKARAIAALLLLMGLSFGLGAAITLNNGSSIGVMSLSFYLSTTAVMMLVGYGISRSRFFVWGATFAFIPLLLPAYFLLFTPPLDQSTVNSTYIWLVLPLLFGSVLLSRRGYVMLSFFTIIAPLLLPLFVPAYSYADLGQMIGFVLLIAFLIGIIVRFQEWVEVLRRQTLEVVTEELQAANSLLERRAKVVEASYEINKKLTIILEPQKLISEIINQIQTLFNYNYVQLYLMDEAGENLVVAGGTGEAGHMLFSRGHQLPVGKGLVGQAAATNTYVLVENVSQVGAWVSNPLLPNTKSELAVPIAAGETVLGVLNVQDDEVNALGTEDVALLQTVASAVAIALQNARLYEQTQKRAEHESFVNQINQQLLSAPTMERVLEIAAQELAKSLGVRRATVQLSRVSNGNGRIQEKADAS